MMANGHSIGGEQSGHIIFSKHATTGDGILTSLMLMEVMLESKTTLSELLKDITIFPQVLINVRVHDKKAVKEDNAVQEIISLAEKELGNDGRILVRESGTEPLIRVMVEAKTEVICREQADRIIKVIKKQGHSI
jgi:phosphoglucosamine mutase